jgi:hypothetical protein
MKIQSVVVFLAVALAVGVSLAPASEPTSSAGFTPQTTIAIVDGQWRINGMITYPNSRAQGLLMNVRMANAIFEDRNRTDFDPQANTEKFLKAMPEYVADGVRAFTICLQGGMPGYEGADNTAFEPDGSLRPEYMRRAAEVIEAADAQGAVVILTCYYQRQSGSLKDAAAVRAGVANAAQWVKDRGYTNVLFEVANEFGHGGYKHEILRDENGVIELISLAKKTHPGLLVASSRQSHRTPADATYRAEDFILVHFNQLPTEGIPDFIANLKKYGKPVVCNEDSKIGEEGAKAAELAVRSGASWGLMVIKHNQNFPKDRAQGLSFNGIKDDPAVYAKIKELTSP